MKNVRNNAKLMSTELGGVCCKPIAVRTKEKTITIRVKEVTITKMDGARLIIVTSATSCNIRLLASPPDAPKSILSDCPHAVCAAHSVTRLITILIQPDMISPLYHRAILRGRRFFLRLSDNIYNLWLHLMAKQQHILFISITGYC